MRILRAVYLGGAKQDFGVDPAYKLKPPRRGERFLRVTKADGQRMLLTTEGLIYATVYDKQEEE